MANWKHLPAELRIQVLTEVVIYRSTKPPGKRRKRKRAVLATVCREWQSLVERHIFRQLTIHQSDISDFASIVRGPRRTYVKWIWLRIELPRYNCGDCNKPESRKSIRTHDFLLTNAVWSLFKTLYDWPKPGDSNPGTTLELSAHSPSDAHHYFKELAPRERDNTLGRARTDLFFSDGHFWINDRRLRYPELGAMKRVFGPSQGLKLDMRAACARRTRKRLPKVEAVNSLIIRGQFYRGFSGTKALWPVIRSLTRLEQFTYESWRTPDRADQAARYEDQVQLFHDALKFSRHLKRVSAFERVYPAMQRPEPLSSDVSLGQKIAKVSQHLEEMHLSFFAEARDFFEAHIRASENGGGFEWPNLRLLSLTSRLLTRQDLDEMIQMAAKTALGMPKLEVMELWGFEAHACIFRYERRLHKPVIVLLRTWHGSLDAKSKASWELLGQTQGLRGELEVVEWIPHSGKAVRRRADVIARLKLKDRILHPTSQRQMRHSLIKEL